MFELKENQFLEKGICKYKDEYGNSAFIKRTDEGFVVKLRFAKDNVKAKPLYISLPLNSGYVGNIDLCYLDEKERNAEDVKMGINQISALIVHWVEMLNDIKKISIGNEILLRMNPGADASAIAQSKYETIKKYEELEDVLSMVGL